MLYALFSGRRPIIGRTQMTEALCAALHCGFPMVEPFPPRLDQPNGEAYLREILRGKGSGKGDTRMDPTLGILRFDDDTPVAFAGHHYGWRDDFWNHNMSDPRRRCLVQAFDCEVTSPGLKSRPWYSSQTEIREVRSRISRVGMAITRLCAH